LLLKVGVAIQAKDPVISPFLSGVNEALARLGYMLRNIPEQRRPQALVGFTCSLFDKYSRVTAGFYDFSFLRTLRNLFNRIITLFIFAKKDSYPESKDLRRCVYFG
jgi:hypothetical protein